MKLILSLSLWLASLFLWSDDFIQGQTQQPKTTAIPAPAFSLKDLEGNTVTLKDQKGKVVILDFWATWCGPCIKSFPSMQTAIDRYKDDPNVVFLFINTWEQRQDPLDFVRNFMDRKGYDFTVLMDVKEPGSAEKLVVDSYGVRGIPAKFIIDGKGNIRFSLMGFSGADEAEIAELVAMIEEAKEY